MRAALGLHSGIALVTNGMPLYLFMAVELWRCVCRGGEQALCVRLPALLLSNSLQASCLWWEQDRVWVRPVATLGLGSIVSIRGLWSWLLACTSA